MPSINQVSEDTTEIIAHMSPRISLNEDFLPALEWPQLASFDGIEEEEEEEVRRTEWQNYEIPAELEMIDSDVPQELQEILQNALKEARGIITAQQTKNELVVVVGVPPPQPIETTGSETSSCEGGRQSRTLSTSSGSTPSPSIGGKPTIKMGPLGWIITSYPEGHNKPKKAKKHKEPKQDGIITKYLKEKKAEKATGECASCMDDIPNKKLRALSCTHKYCFPCFEQLVMTAAQNENQFPPKCCLQEIPVKLILSSLPSEQKERFKLKAQEFAVPALNRWYCPSPPCAKWIPLNKLKRGNTDQVCPYCKIGICGTCRGRAHTAGEECPQDFGLEATLEVADREGWRRCCRCRAVVELTAGCRHITCVCKAQFCYTCGAVWRTCACTEVDQARRQQEIADRRAERERQTAEELARAATEEAEAAAAIAAVERQEREEAEERERQEQLRQEEEARQREREAVAAREREEARINLLHRRATEFQSLLRNIHTTQRGAIINRHRDETDQLHEDIELSSIGFSARQNLLRMTLRQNLQSRLYLLESEQRKVLGELATRHEEEEDDLFVRVTTHLRNKPNREARERSMVEKLQKTQEEERVALQLEQKHKREELEWMGGMESRNLEDSMRLKREQECCDEGDRVAALVRSVFADRRWFETVSARRDEMIIEWRDKAITSGLLLNLSTTQDPRMEVPELDAVSTTVVASSSPSSERGSDP